ASWMTSSRVFQHRCSRGYPSLRRREAFGPEPGIGAERTQGDFIRVLLDLDLMDPDGAGSAFLEEFLRSFLALRRVNPNPQDEPACRHQRFQPATALPSEE